MERQTDRTVPALLVVIVAVSVSVALGAAVARLPLRDLTPVLIASVIVAVVASSGRPRVVVAIGAVVYVAAVHWSYVGSVVPWYASEGLIESGVEWPDLVVVSAIALAPCAWMPIGLKQPSDILLWFLYLLGYIPVALIPIHVIGPSLSAVLPLELAVAAAFGTLGLMQRLPRMTPRWPGMSEGSFVRLLVAVGLGAIPYLIIVFAPTSLPDFGAVYDTRALFAATVTTSLGSGYVVPWLSYVIYPFLMALGMAWSRSSLVVLGMAGQILIYAITGLKGVLFSIILVPLVYLAIRHAGRAFGALLVWGGVLVVWLSVVAIDITGSIVPLALFVTRLIAIPGQLTAYYFDFFSSHATYMLSYSFLRWFLHAPYDIEAPYLIGRLYLHTAEDANANLWADAMANFGVSGIIPVTVVLGIVLWILDSFAAGRDLRVIGPVLALGGLALANGALFTSILTGGLGVAIALIALMPRSRIQATSDVDAGSPIPRRSDGLQGTPVASQSTAPPPVRAPHVSA